MQKFALQTFFKKRNLCALLKQSIRSCAVLISIFGCGFCVCALKRLEFSLRSLQLRFKLLRFWLQTIIISLLSCCKAKSNLSLSRSITPKEYKCENVSADCRFTSRRTYVPAHLCRCALMSLYPCDCADLMSCALLSAPLSRVLPQLQFLSET